MGRHPGDRGDWGHTVERGDTISGEREKR